MTMPRVVFTANLQRHIAVPPTIVNGKTAREVLDNVFLANPLARGYVLDDGHSLRKHMVVFVDGEPLQDRTHLSDPVGDDSEIYVMQALSGG